jgi:hypothetical protein
VFETLDLLLKHAKVQRSVTKVSLYFFTESVLEVLDTPPYLCALNRRPEMYVVLQGTRNPPRSATVKEGLADVLSL